MARLQLKIIDRARPEKDPDAGKFFVESYLGLRFMIGLLAFTLPYFLILFDWWALDQDQIRGSISAYYHSPARDLFVGGLVMVGAFLIGYMTGKTNTWDFWLSVAAGVAVLLVAFFPTGRDIASGEKVKVSQDSCDRYPGPPACNDIQQYWGEAAVRVVHQSMAALFVVLLAALCLVFALREFGYGTVAERSLGVERKSRKAMWEALGPNEGRWRSLWVHLWKQSSQYPDPADPHPSPVTPGPPARRVVLYLGTGAAILLGGIWALTGIRLPLPFTPYTLGSVYVGEVIALTAFGIAWLVAGKDMGAVKKATDAVAAVVTKIVPTK